METDRTSIDSLFIAAHPDDVEFCAAGTIRQMADAGMKTHIMLLTRGDAGTYGTPDGRTREAQDAAAIMGASIDVYQFKDGHLRSDLDARWLAEQLRVFRPHTVFSLWHGPHDSSHHFSNPDHEAVGLRTREALKYARLRNHGTIPGEPWKVDHVLWYMIPILSQPTHVVDVSRNADVVEAAVAAHASQAPHGLIDKAPRHRTDNGAALGTGPSEVFLYENPGLYVNAQGMIQMYRDHPAATAFQHSDRWVYLAPMQLDVRELRKRGDQLVGSRLTPAITGADLFGDFGTYLEPPQRRQQLV